jgi:DNA mismatch repair protein MutL
MLPVSEKNCSGVVVRGLISLPWDTRSNSAGITISVSGRVIRNRDLVDVIRKGYGSRLMKGRFPLAVIDIEIPSGMTDVNVHPTKSLVKFSNETDVLRCLEERVSEAVFTPPGKKRSLEGKTSEPEIKPELQKERIPRQIPLMQGEIRAETPHPDQWSRIPKMEGIKRLPPVIPDEVSGLKMRVIGQLDRTYILCELGSDLILVDQHAAHERIRLETLTAKYGDKGGVQKLLEPIHLEMDRTSVERLMNNKDQLFSLGFDYEIFSGTDIVVRSLPTFMGRMEAKEVLQDLGTGNELHDGCTPPDREFLPGDLPVKERLLSLTACRGAIKAHEHLSLSQMEKLLKDLFECEIPLHCAHGRPTMIRLPLSALERWFKRVL